MSGAGPRRFVFTVSQERDGGRLDQVVAAEVSELSRRKVRVLIDLGGVFVDRKRVKVASRVVRAGQSVEVVVGGAFERSTKKVGNAARQRDQETLPDYDVLYQDDDLIVVLKPAGLLTAPTPESDRGNLADLLERRLGQRVFVVHRLDLPTSGVLVVARSEAANRKLSDAFRVHDVGRRYLAFVDGRWPPEVTRVESPVGGRAARTDVEVLERFGDGVTLLQATLHTGRTHQIRIHASSTGHPVAGDRRYGARRDDPDRRPPRLALHATHLAFRHPVTGAELTFDAELPEDLATWAEGLRGRSGASPA